VSFCPSSTTQRSIEEAWKTPLIAPKGRIYILISQRLEDLVKIYELFTYIIGYLNLGFLNAVSKTVYVLDHEPTCKNVSATSN
jgi:hypothetical protein